MRYHVCLSCQKLIGTPHGVEGCNCAERKPSKMKFEIGEGAEK